MPTFNIKAFVDEHQKDDSPRNTPGSNTRKHIKDHHWQSDDTFAHLVKPLKVEATSEGMIKAKRFEGAKISPKKPKFRTVIRLREEVLQHDREQQEQQVK